MLAMQWNARESGKTSLRWQENDSSYATKDERLIQIRAFRFS